MFPGDKILDTSLQRIAFHKYQDYSLARMARLQVGNKYKKMANRIDILSTAINRRSKLLDDVMAKQMVKEASKNNWDSNFAVKSPTLKPSRDGHYLVTKTSRPELSVPVREVSYLPGEGRTETP